MAEAASGERWDYSAGIVQYGEDTTYRLGISWLAETCATIEDWGAGAAYAHRFVPEGITYTAIDWASSAWPWSAVITDVASYHPDPAPDGILLRHVIEHNDPWQPVLDNAVATFRKRLALVIFTPFGEVTRRLTDQWPVDWSFRKDDLTARFAGLHVRDEHADTAVQYGHGEHVFYVERP